ncbi:MAG: hypothetical protein Q6M04_02045 [Thermostichus sp. BF3_bins_97]
MLSFWVRRNHQEDWKPVPAEGTVLEEDTYSIVARSPQPHFTITVEVRQYPLPTGNGSEPAPVADPNTSPPHIQTRSVRTNDEGIGIILPASHLTPGFWELHCRDADLIAELFGEAEVENCLRFQVLPVGRRLEMTPPPLPEPETGIPATAEEAWSEVVLRAPDPGAHPPEPSPEPTREWAAELFSLMHTELEGSPDEVLVLTGRIGCSGELRVQVWQEGKDLPIFEGQRLIQFPPEARTAVFSIPITLPNRVWTRPLTGELLLTPSSTGWRDPERPSQPLTIPFFIRCRGQSEELDPAGAEELASAPSSSGIPLSRLRAGAAQAAGSRHSARSASGGVEATLLSPERTLQKLLRIWQQSTPVQGRDSAEPVVSAQEVRQDPAHEEAATPPPASPAPVVEPENRKLPIPEPPPEGIPAPSPESILQPAPEPELYRIPEAEVELPSPVLEPSPSLQPEPTQSEAEFPATPVALAPVLPVVSPEESLLPPSPPGICPTPQLLVPEQLRAGDNFDVVLRLPALADPPPSGFTNQAPFWIKFWVKHGRTRSLVDGPRWLLDFSCDEQGQWQALTRMTIPPGVPELIFEAWAVSPDRQQQSDRVTERRLIQP